MREVLARPAKQSAPGTRLPAMTVVLPTPFRESVIVASFGRRKDLPGDGQTKRATASGL